MKISGILFSSGASTGPTTSYPGGVGDFTGRYVPKQRVTSRLFKFLSHSFDNRFLVSLVRFVFNHLIARVLSTQAISSRWYTASLRLFLFLGKFINWSVIVSMIIAGLIYAYGKITSLIHHIFSREPHDFWSRLKGLTYSMGTSRESSWLSLSMPKKLFGLETTTGLSNWLPSSVLEQAFLFIVGAVIFYFLIRYVVRKIIRGLVSAFSWATPTDLKALHEIINRHAALSIQNFREMGNLAILIDNITKELKKNNNIEESALQGLKDLEKDVEEIRKLEQSFETTIKSLSEKLDNASQSSDTAIHTLMATFKVLKEAMDGKQLTKMESGLLDAATFDKSYKIVQDTKENQSIITRLSPLTVRRLIDPDAEVTTHVAQILSAINQGAGNKGKEDKTAITKFVSRLTSAEIKAILDELDKKKGKEVSTS